jgi:hypothetical protein
MYKVWRKSVQERENERAWACGWEIKMSHETENSSSCLNDENQHDIFSPFMSVL